MDKPHKREVPQAFIDDLNASLDKHDPPLSPEERIQWFDRIVETYHEGVEHGLVEAQAEVHVAGLVGERISKDLLQNTLGSDALQEFKAGDMSEETLCGLLDVILQTAFLKGFHGNYLLREKGVTNHEELYQQLTQNKT